MNEDNYIKPDYSNYNNGDEEEKVVDFQDSVNVDYFRDAEPKLDLAEDEFELNSEYHFRLMEGNKDVKLVDNNSGKGRNYQLYKKKGVYGLSQKKIKDIEDRTEVSPKKIERVISNISDYINNLGFVEEELTSIYFPQEGEKEFIIKNTELFIKDNNVFVDNSTRGSSNEDIYVFDEEYNKFLLLDTDREMINYIRRKYGTRILHTQASAILKGIDIYRDGDPNTFQYNNGYYNVVTGEFSQEPVFTHFHINYDYVELADAQEGTLLEENLKKILIPKNNPEDTKLYTTVLWYIGACLSNDKPKVIVEFFGDGDDAKSVLLKIFKILYGKMNYSVDEKELVDKFTPALFGNKCTLILNELSADAFEDPKSLRKIKEISGNDDVEVRRIKTDDMITVENTGLVMCCSNHLPAVPHSSDAYYNRLQFFKMPNKFKSEDTGGDNVYIADNNIMSELKQDKAGFSWLIAKALSVYNDPNINFGDIEQKREETLMIINESDLLSQFITSCVIETPGAIVSNKELCYYFMLFCLQKDMDYTDVDGLKANKRSLSILMGNYIKGKNFKGGDDSKGKFYRDCAVHLDVPEEQLFSDYNYNSILDTFFLK